MCRQVTELSLFQTDVKKFESRLPLQKDLLFLKQVGDSNLYPTEIFDRKRRLNYKELLKLECKVPFSLEYTFRIRRRFSKVTVDYKLSVHYTFTKYIKCTTGSNFILLYRGKSVYKRCVYLRLVFEVKVVVKNLGLRLRFLYMYKVLSELSC